MIGISVQNDKALAAALRNISDDVRDKAGIKAIVARLDQSSTCNAMSAH